jgi:hypothetical protein
MPDKKTETEAPQVEPGRYTEPREKNDPGHKDAGQLYVEEQQANAEKKSKKGDA